MPNLLLTVILIFLSMGNSHAYDFAAGTKSGDNWMAMCGKYGMYEELDVGCNLYTGGVIEGWMFGYVASSMGKSVENFSGMYCRQEQTTTRQHILVIKKYMDDHPQHLHRPAAVLIMRALAEAFPYPCRNTNR